MAVALLPPITSSLNRPDAEPLTEAPRYVRTGAMTRWHRSRCGYRDKHGTVLHTWCGGGCIILDGDQRSTRLGIGVDEVPTGEPVCGVCVGKALGAKQDLLPAGLPLLRFDPRHLTPPTLCPGSRNRDLWEPLNTRGNVGRCLACQDVVPIRAVGRGYSAYGAGPTNHAPGNGLFEPCPWHAWMYASLRQGGSVGCSCTTTPSPGDTSATSGGGVG
jgi:hypothetical protein